jgi:hypothetical protein
MGAGERRHAVDQFDGVMSHSFKSSPLSGMTAEPKLLRLEIGIQPVCQRRESADRFQSLFCAGRVMAIACDFYLL